LVEVATSFMPGSARLYAPGIRPVDWPCRTL
jgi:hypothetical protein